MIAVKGEADAKNGTPSVGFCFFLDMEADKWYNMFVMTFHTVKAPGQIQILCEEVASLKVNKKSGSRTLLLSVILSSPSPIVVGIGLMFGHSATQIADLIRRTAELFGIIAAYITYVVTNREDSMQDPAKKEKIEKNSHVFVGAMMYLSGIVMFVLDFIANDADCGNVIPGLIIASTGAVANGAFCVRYTKLNRKIPNSVLAVQARLYGAKCLVDSCVSLALLVVSLLPGTGFAYYFDLVGSAIVAIYLIYCGARTLVQDSGKQK